VVAVESDREKRIAILSAIYAYLSVKRRRAAAAPRHSGVKAWRLAASLYEDPVAGY